MQSKEKDNLIIIRLFSNEDINKKLIDACKFYNVKTAIIISGLGQIKKFQLGYFRKKNNYIIKKFNKPYELLSLTGNICYQNDEYILHLHAVLSDENKNTVGGHLIEGKVEITNEIALLKTDLEIKRVLEENSGLKGLILE